MFTLLKNRVWSLGIVRPNRVPGKAILNNDEMKNDVEKITFIDDIELRAVSWLGNKTVNLLSSYIGSLPIQQTNRSFRKEKERRGIPCPQAVTVYDMGDVNLLDPMLGIKE